MRYALAGVALVTAVAGGFLLVSRDRSETQTVEPVSSETEALRQELAKAEAEEERLRAELAEAEAKNCQLETEASEALELAEAASVIQETEPEDKVDAEEESDSARRASLDEIRERIRNNRGASAQIKALTEVMYADFLNSVDLNPEEKAELRRLLTESLMESMALSRYALGEGDLAWSDVRGWQLDERAFLDEQLKQLLPPEAYQTWTEYFADIDARQLEGNLRNQIRAVASGLSPASFDQVLQVAVEEFRAQQIALEQSTQLFTLQENVNYQLRAIQAMRLRLVEMLSEQQLAEIENWMSMSERLLSAQLPNDA